MGLEGAFMGVVLSTGLTVFFVVLVVGLMALGAIERRQRLRAVVGQRSNRLARGAPGRSAPLRSRALAFMRGWVDRVNLLRERQIDALRHELVKAGLRSRDAVIVYVFLKITLPVAAGGGAALWFMFVRDFGLQPVILVGIVIGAALAGSYLPDLYLRNLAQRRQYSIRRTLPDALDLMVICAEAGLSLDAALQRVSGEIGPSSRPLADELAYTGIELRFLPERRKAMENLARRVPLPAVRALVNTLTQTERYGTPLAHALRVLADEQRTERMLRAEEKAARLPAIMTVPLIAFILPALFVVLLGPAALSIADSMLIR